MVKRVSVCMSIAVVGAALTALTGCKKPTDEKTATPAVEAEQPDLEQALFEALDATYMKVNELLEQAQTNEAVALFEMLQADPQWRDWSERLFSEKIRFQLYIGQDELVREQVLQACAAGPVAHARTGLQMLLAHLHESQGIEAAYDLTDAVAALPDVADELVRLTTEWRFFSALHVPDMERATEALATVLHSFPAADANKILSSAFDTLFSSGRLDDLQALHTLAATTAEADAGRAQLLTTTAIRLAAQRGDWPTTERLFLAATAELPDASLQHLLAQILPTARRAGRYDVIDHCAEEVLFKQAAKTAAADRAARFWVESAMATNRAAFPQRLNALLSTKIPSQTVGSLFTRYFYDLIDNTEVIQKMLPIADKLLIDADDDMAKMIKTMRLDGTFVLEDYDTAVGYLEAGIPERDDAWHKMAISKVKAHRALKKNQPREAVAFFREFMACIDDVKDDDTVDPSTGIQHTKDMLRGRNAKRIAEILATIPDVEAAAKVRIEAADYYKKALAETTDEESRAIITEEAGDLLQP